MSAGPHKAEWECAAGRGGQWFSAGKPQSVRLHVASCGRGRWPGPPEQLTLGPV
ncbi:GM18780 [Drosophila sechellia]|uniref:GM18780 n=1 Tax=Drosophila sechellia TaxID=7238 RepID=B4IQL6_DROSE|nr:GM18780 [Drosophila sechellia]